MKKFLLTAFFWVVIVILIHMIVFVTLEKTVAQLLGFIGVLAHAFGSLYIARLITKKIFDHRLPTGQPPSVAQARADAIQEAIDRGDIDHKKYNDFIGKLAGDTTTTTSAPKPSPTEQDTTTETVIHFVIKNPPPGVTRTAENSLITAKVARTVGPDGKCENKISAFAGADPLTFVEASSAIYWRDHIEGGYLTDDYVIDCLNAVGRHTFQNYLPANSDKNHPNEVAITTGLTQLSLHYAIAFLDQLGLPQSTLDWMDKQRAKGPSFERVVDYKKADSLKESLADADIDPDFLSHVKRSVDRSKK